MQLNSGDLLVIAAGDYHSAVRNFIITRGLHNFLAQPVGDSNPNCQIKFDEILEISLDGSTLSIALQAEY